MTQASALLLIQDSRFNKQIPGKVYEYLRTEKPLLVKADLAGETTKLVNKFSGVGLGNKGEELADKLNSRIQQEPYTYIRNLEQYTREKKSRELECIMKRLLD